MTRAHGRTRRSGAARVLGALLLLGLAGAGRAAAQTHPPMDTKMHSGGIHTYLLLDELEFVPGGAENPVRLDGEGWIGGERNRFWFRAEGEHATADGEGDVELQALYSRLISPFWDAQAGIRVDTRYGDERATRKLLALGLEGLAPYWFEVQPMLFVSEDGDLSARLSASYDLLFTQRLVAQPSVELNAAAQAVPEFGVGSGLNDVELGMRLRYELKREFAPYVGVSWTRRVGETADFARDLGEGASDFSFVLGLRLWR